MPGAESNFNYFILAASSIGLTLLGIIAYLHIKLRGAEQNKRVVPSKFQQFENNINSLRLENLESKLNPHLFKNILNSIQSHAYQTYFALDKLANVLDYILYESKNRFVTPKEEIEFALNLIEINKIKVSPLFELKVKTRISENELLYEQPLLAPLISIDLIENAFKHADVQSPDAFIAIVFEFRQDSFFLTVSNKMSATLDAWKKLLESKSLWLSDIPSTLIIAEKKVRSGNALRNVN